MSYDKRMDNLPLFISFPRCGSHWLNCVMELYFDRPRLREGRTTFLPPNRKDWMWFHDHDLELNLGRKNVLYLYRDPVDVMFSDTMSEKGQIDKNFIKRRTQLYNKHLCLYLVNYAVKYYMKYENLLLNFNKEFKIAVDFFNKDLNEEKLNEVKKIVTKDTLAKISKNKQFINKELTSKQYSDKRRWFRKEYSDMINDIVIKSDLEEFFD